MKKRTIALLALAAALLLGVAAVVYSPVPLDAPFVIDSAALHRVDPTRVRLTFTASPEATHSIVYRLGFTSGDVGHHMLFRGRAIPNTMTDVGAAGLVCYLSYETAQDDGATTPIRMAWLGCTS